MLAADIGTMDIPSEHPDAANFLPSQLEPGLAFDLVLCDGQVLSTHQRASYRGVKEGRRLTLTQLAIGLEHLRPGGAMIVLVHKVEAFHNVQLLYTFNKFASVRLFKPPRIHAKRSSFYMLATNVNVSSGEAAIAVERWKRMWNITTFGTDDMYHNALSEEESGAEMILNEFGSKFVMLGKNIWRYLENPGKCIGKSHVPKGDCTILMYQWFPFMDLKRNLD